LQLHCPDPATNDLLEVDPQEVQKLIVLLQVAQVLLQIS
jgi:hypothetical protein